MFNNIFCEMKGKKGIQWGVGPGGTVQISSWKCNFSIYLDIQAITTLLCLLSVLYVLIQSIHLFFYSFYSFIFSPEKWHFLALKSLLFLQFSTYRHWTGFIVKRKQACMLEYLGIPINFDFFLLQISLPAYNSQPT